LADCFHRLREDFGLAAAIRCCCLVPREVLEPARPVRTWLEWNEEAAELAVHRAEAALLPGSGPDGR